MGRVENFYLVNLVTHKKKYTAQVVNKEKIHLRPFQDFQKLLLPTFTATD